MCIGIVGAAEKKSADDCHKGETKTHQGCVKDPKIIHKTQPVYPPEARKRGVDGSVTLQSRVTVEGTVDEITVLNVQATDASFNESLQGAAITALKQWKYRPGTIGGKPVAIYFTVVIDFLSGQ